MNTDQAAQLAETLDKACQVLQSRALTSEHHTRTAVINPILRSLGWDETDVGQWLPEYPIEGVGRVDDALLGHDGRPRVFIEAKKPGGLSPKAQGQLFSYAANKGVPLVVLTDGDVWDLYLSMASGAVSERQFAHLEITNRAAHGDAAMDLMTFLAREEVLSPGDRANIAAQERLRSNTERGRSKEALPAAWSAVLADDLLRDWLSEFVEGTTGIKPHADDVEAFLRRHSDPAGTAGDAEAAAGRSTSQQPTGKAPKRDSKTSRKNPKRAKPTSICSLVFKGKLYEVPSSSGAIVLAAELLEKHSPGMLGRLSRVESERARPLVLRDLPAAAAYAGYYAAVPGTSWHILKHASTNDARKRIRRMAEFAGLTSTDVTTV